MAQDPICLGISQNFIKWDIGQPLPKFMVFSLARAKGEFIPQPECKGNKVNLSLGVRHPNLFIFVRRVMLY